jgi:hypothetical protein
VAIVFNGSRIIETMDLKANYLVQIIVDKYFPELVDDYRIRKAIKQDTEEENLINEKYEKIAKRKLDIWKLFTLLDIYLITEQEKKKLENYWINRKAITTRNRFNLIIKKRNARFKPNTRFVKKMIPCPSPIHITQIIQIDNRFYLSLSYKIWMLANDIYTKQHLINVRKFFENQKYMKTLTWIKKKEVSPINPIPIEKPKQTRYSPYNYNSKRPRPRYRDLFTYKTPEPEIIITTYQTTQLKEKIYLLPLILFKKLVDELDTLKRLNQKSIPYDKYRKHTKNSILFRI